MPLNNFSVGHDLQLTVVTGSGPLVLNLVTEFQSKQDVTKVKSKGMDGITRNVNFPDGWSGSIMLDRRNSTIDDYFAQLEADYFNGIQHSSVNLTQTITEVNGSVSQYRYTKVVFDFEDAGSWAGDKLVKQKLGFVAEKRIKLA